MASGKLSAIMNRSSDPAADPTARRANALRANQQCYDALVANQAALCRPASDEELADPLGTLDPIGWLGGNVHGKRLLCLAAGGGRQSAIYATAGADVTVVDISPAMLELDRQVAARRRLQVRLLQASMDRLDMLADASFDIVVHPVSTCYVPDVMPVFQEVARVLSPGGIYISQHKSPTSLQASHRRNATACYQIEHSYYRSDPIPAPTQQSAASQRLRERGAVEYLHRLEQLIGGICRNRMVIEDFIEPMHADDSVPRDTFGDRACFIAPYLRIKARRVGGGTQRPSTVATPDTDSTQPANSGRIIIPN
jgi:SAM-dependent methyltransferase